jgi:hypothetical protein
MTDVARDHKTHVPHRQYSVCTVHASSDVAPIRLKVGLAILDLHFPGLVQVGRELFRVSSAPTHFFPGAISGKDIS